jgi:hypothetical protein
MTSDRFDDLLDRAIDAAPGAAMDEALARANGDRRDVEDLVELARQLRADAARRTPGISPRLAENWAIVRAAVERAQLAEREASAPPRERRVATPWWRRRVALASLSMPAGVAIALVLVGSGGAAAATLAAVGPDRTLSTVTEFSSAAVHRAADSLESLPVVGGGRRDDAPAAGTPKPPAERGAAATQPAEDAPGQAVAATSQPQDDLTLEGVVSRADGITFTLTVDTGEQYKVDTDASTSGDVASEGARVRVRGRLTGGRNLHADDVRVVAAPPGAPDATETPSIPGPPDGTPVPTKTANDNGSDHTPGPPADHTPGPPADRTPGPPGDHTPPGEGGGGPPNGRGNGNGIGNGNGGGPKKP